MPGVRRKKRVGFRKEVTAEGDQFPASSSMVADSDPLAEFVERVLEEARAEAVRQEIPVNGGFSLTITGAPAGITIDKVLLELVKRDADVGLKLIYSHNEKVTFARIR